jgi:hypothetical protein
MEELPLRYSLESTMSTQWVNNVFLMYMLVLFLLYITTSFELAIMHAQVFTSNAYFNDEKCST